MTTEDRSALADASGAPTLVLLSGMLGDESLWRGVLQRLDPLTKPLCLRSDSGATVGAVAAAVLDAAPPSFALAGHSFGGIVALEVQRLAPHRVARLALLSASGRPGSTAQKEGWSTLRERTLAGEFSTVVEELAILTLPQHHRTPELVAQGVAMSHVVGASGLLRQLAAQGDRPDSLPRLAGIDVPTAVVIGELDEVCPPDLQHEVARTIPGAVTHIISGAGHMSPLEAPDQVAQVLRTWLSAATAPRHPGTRDSRSRSRFPRDKESQ
ncbi:MAG: alpha/beta hydrolase [Humibacillus sp.]|nr:alpha/beta hydrolase [Humibacillus sp.]MDN5779475.1 alpha/beta hydrolase [Humibacillus sp.]